MTAGAGVPDTRTLITDEDVMEAVRIGSPSALLVHVEREEVRAKVARLRARWNAEARAACAAELAGFAGSLPGRDDLGPADIAQALQAMAAAWTGE